jgi:hypothetical protein
VSSPSPRAIRLVRRAVGTPPPVPFGLAAWSDDPSADIAVVVEANDDWPSSGLGDARAIAPEIPAARELAAGALVVVIDASETARGFFAKLARKKRPPVARAVRGSALLARGFVRLGGGVDDASGLDLAWGYAPER